MQDPGIDFPSPPEPGMHGLQGIAAGSENALDLLLALSTDIVSCRTREDLRTIVKNRLAAPFQLDDLLIFLNDPDNATHSCYLHVAGEQTVCHPDFARMAAMVYPAPGGIFPIIEGSGSPVIFDLDELLNHTGLSFFVGFWREQGVREIIGFPLRVNDGCIGLITLYPKTKNSLTAGRLRLVQAVCSYLGIALATIFTHEKMQTRLEAIDRYKYRLEEENLYLQEEIRTTFNHEEVIGSDNGLRDVFQLLSNVSGSDCTVLILGETGTGKELIARAIHNASPRRHNLMVKVNCAALPAQLIESELFGHERGSFTGATERRIGKFELANNGTLFLDEIGEMAPGLQIKVLRALQEREIERIGGKEVIRTDVRIITATNRDLQKEVEAGTFRADLYYRLNVFPILLPPLRERRQDIPVLVAHFIEKLRRRSGKNISQVSPKAMQELEQYHWPGNVRELEHVIERSFLMTNRATITEIYLPGIGKGPAVLPDELPVRSLEQNERNHILSVLNKCHGRIRGAAGAAELLKIPPTTLHSKIKKLGIRKTGY